MDDLRDRYDDLYNIVSSLDLLVDETEDEYYKGTFKDLRIDAQTELEEVEERLSELEKQEQDEMNREYERSVIDVNYI